MTHILLKRVYEADAPDDGFRVLVDRLWPRGIKKEALKMDLWAKEATPSTALRKWFHEDPQHRWDEFSRLYRQELADSPAAKDLAQTVKRHKVTTLLYAGKDSEHTHAKVLKAYLEKHLDGEK